jgi:hypothetical protein
MKNNILFKAAILAVAYSFTFFAAAKMGETTEIKCDDTEQCKRKFIAASEWIRANTLLAIIEDSPSTLLTEVSCPECKGDYSKGDYVRLRSGGRWPRNLASQFEARMIGRLYIIITTRCSNPFGCNPSTDWIHGELKRYIDEREPVLLQKLIQEEQNREKIKHNQYRSAFINIKTSAGAASFIQKHQNDDIDNLIPEARVLETELKAKEELAREAEEGRRQLQARANEIERQKRTTYARVSTIELRKKIKLGDETHCGMVIDTKLPLVKVQTMIGERWFKLDQIYPRGGAPCQFHNGTYQDVGSEYGFN